MEKEKKKVSTKVLKNTISWRRKLVGKREPKAKAGKGNLFGDELERGRVNWMS